MAFFERPLAVPPGTFDLARKLEDRPGAVLVGLAGKGTYLASDPVETVRSLDPEPSLELAAGSTELSGIPRWVGLLPYEARRGLERPEGAFARDPRPAPHVAEPVWFRYAAVAEIGRGVRVLGEDEQAVSELSARLSGPVTPPAAPRLALAEPLEPVERHLARIRRALTHIERGDIYQVNLARRFRFHVSGSRFGLLASLCAPEPPPFPFALQCSELDVVGASPELFVELGSDRRLRTQPIKGTRPRASDPRRDAQLIRELAENDKECAELTMILDVERNDLGRLALAGSVRVEEPPHVVTFGTVHHRLATLVADLRPDLARKDVLEAMLPSGSVTGAPKVRAMELIAELEAHRRGLYTGAVGVVCHDGSMTLAMAIRTLTVVAGEGHYFSGGGIVADSNPELEVQETLWKAARILTLAGGSADNWA